jgi:hypothetical protein
MAETCDRMYCLFVWRALKSLSLTKTWNCLIEAGVLTLKRQLLTAILHNLLEIDGLPNSRQTTALRGWTPENMRV